MRHISTGERRVRLARRHRLAAEAQAEDVVEAARSLVGFHASDPPSVFMAARARVPRVRVEGVEHALYGERSLVRMTGVRKTLFVVPAELVPVVRAVCLTRIAPQERRRLVRMVEGAGIAADGGAWVERVEDEALAALAARGEAAGAELSNDVPALRERIRFGEGKRWEGTMTVTGRLLSVLAAEGRVVRGRPRGTWVSGQYRWVPIDAWLADGMPPLPAHEAEAELARRWLRAFGPGTADDLKWWTGWTVTQVRRVLAALGAEEVALEGSTIGLVLPDDLDAMQRPAPWAALLPPLDSTVMGWAERRWFLGDHGPALFDGNGNAGPTVWWDGRVVGGWGQGPGGKVVHRLLEDPGADARAAIEAEAERLDAWLGETRVTPRFRTPLERELAR